MNMLCNKTFLEKKTGAYKLSCNHCECFYISQTGSGFQEHFSEHTPKHNLEGQIKIYNYARQLITENYRYTSYNSNLKPIYICNKGIYMNSWKNLGMFTQ